MSTATPLQRTARFRPCAIVPTYDNPATVAHVVGEIARVVETVVVVDDGSAEATRSVLEGLSEATVIIRHEVNRGKGAAMCSGFAEARRRGFTHALQVDADAQHDLSRAPSFLEAAREHPDALVLGYPVYDHTAPRNRVLGRKVSRFWVAVETRSRAIVDPMVGFRVYPMHQVDRVRCRSQRMAIDIEIAVRLVNAGVPVVNLPVAVRYPTASEGGVSHFRMVRDNVAISCLHAELTTEMLARSVIRLLRRQ